MTQVTTPRSTARPYMRGAEPFELAGGEAGILLLHGFSGSVSEVRALGELVHHAGFGVLAPALAGHGTHPSDLSAVSADDFFARAEEALQIARRRYRRVYVVGFSLGGTLGLHLAARHELAGVVAIATPVFLSMPVRRGIPLADRWSPWRNVVSNSAAWRREVVGYRMTPVSSLVVLLDVIERVRQELDWVRAPLLLLHSRHDESVPASNAAYIAAHAASSIKQVHTYGSGRHLMTVPPYLAVIKPQILRFLREREQDASLAESTRQRRKGAPR